MNLVVFASGSGTTLQSIIDAIENNELGAKINLVVSNNIEAYALERAKNAHIPTYVIKEKENIEIDNELINVLKKFDVDLIVLAGYLKLIGKELINNYTIVNTHPSLLPKFGGKGMYGMKVHTAVIEAKEKESGPTVHYVNGKYDEGDIIKQTKVLVDVLDTPETLAAKVQEVEKLQLIGVLQEFSNNLKRKR